MTDEDRYARKLGKRFETVRGILCSLETQHQAPAEAARYIIAQLLKDIDLKAVFENAAQAIASRSGWFADSEALERIERSAADSQGAEHFAEAMREVLEVGDSTERILEHLARLAVEGTGHRVKLQRGYRDDVECQVAYARHERAITDELLTLLRRKCGLPTAPAAMPAVRGDQAALLEFVVVREP